MGFVIAFFLGVGFAVFILSLMRASSASDQIAEAYWEGYRHGADDVEGGMVPRPTVSAADPKRAPE